MNSKTNKKNTMDKNHYLPVFIQRMKFNTDPKNRYGVNIFNSKTYEYDELINVLHEVKTSNFLKSLYEDYQLETDDKIKKQIKQHTFLIRYNGLFQGGTEYNNVVALTGLIFIDIDNKDMSKYGLNTEQLFKVLNRQEDIVYSHNSISGGITAIFYYPIKDILNDETIHIKLKFKIIADCLINKLNNEIKQEYNIIDDNFNVIDNGCKQVNRSKYLNYSEYVYVNPLFIGTENEINEEASYYYTISNMSNTDLNNIQAANILNALKKPNYLSEHVNNVILELINKSNNEYSDEYNSSIEDAIDFNKNNKYDIKLFFDDFNDTDKNKIINTVKKSFNYPIKENGFCYNTTTRLAGICNSYGISLENAIKLIKEILGEYFDTDPETNQNATYKRIKAITSIYTKYESQHGERLYMFKTKPFQQNIINHEFKFDKTYQLEDGKKVSNIIDKIMNETNDQFIWLQSNTGTGKTYGLLEWGFNLLNKVNDLDIPNEINKIIFICPKTSIAEGLRKYSQWNPYIYHSSIPNEEYINCKTNNKLIVSTWDQLDKITNMIEGGLSNCLLIIDEVHELIEAYNYKQEVIESIIKNSVKYKKVLALTGTTIAYKEFDWYNRFKFINIESTLPEKQYTIIDKKTNDFKTDIFNRLIENKLNVIYINDKSFANEYMEFLTNINLNKVKSYNVQLFNSEEKKKNDTINQILKSELIDEKVEVLIVTSLFESGIDIKNTNLGNVFVINNRSNFVSVETIQQLYNRFRIAIPNHLFVYVNLEKEDIYYSKLNVLIENETIKLNNDLTKIKDSFNLFYKSFINDTYNFDFLYDKRLACNQIMDDITFKKYIHNFNNIIKNNQDIECLEFKLDYLSILYNYKRIQNYFMYKNINNFINKMNTYNFIKSDEISNTIEQKIIDNNQYKKSMENYNENKKDYKKNIKNECFNIFRNIDLFSIKIYENDKVLTYKLKDNDQLFKTDTAFNFSLLKFMNNYYSNFNDIEKFIYWIDKKLTDNSNNSIKKLYDLMNNKINFEFIKEFNQTSKYNDIFINFFQSIPTNVYLTKNNWDLEINKLMPNELKPLFNNTYSFYENIINKYFTLDSKRNSNDEYEYKIICFHKVVCKINNVKTDMTL